MKKEGKTPDEMDTLLNKQSGILGVSGLSSDDRDIKKAARSIWFAAEICDSV